MSGKDQQAEFEKAMRDRYSMYIGVGEDLKNFKAFASEREAALWGYQYRSQELAKESLSDAAREHYLKRISDLESRLNLVFEKGCQAETQLASLKRQNEKLRVAMNEMIVGLRGSAHAFQGILDRANEALRAQGNESEGV